MERGSGVMEEKEPPELPPTGRNTMTDSRNAIGVFCEVSKAFDCVNHETLIRKPHHYEAKGRALDLLASYLTNRIQNVDVNNMRSSGSMLDVVWHLALRTCCGCLPNFRFAKAGQAIRAIYEPGPHVSLECQTPLKAFVTSKLAAKASLLASIASIQRWINKMRKPLIERQL
ncbi:hypothetical protein EVAR_40371_1 [Eumeta japonica]|uniref:Reverse transcriptase domain-containing protein n=1 Tax=Eumeta variegata TaxID=151549 RepID=A0A4C1XJ29_EUMVA|nr:hypothetical protein EVAR_40371_1 [Eumeta japonica]